MSLKEEILNRFPALLENRDDALIASELSANRKKPNTKKIGVPDILSVLGVSAGNTCLDKLKAAEEFRHLWYLLQNNNLPIGDDSVQATLLICGLSEKEQAVLVSLGMTPEVITSSEVTRALGE